jgi:dihydroflavonol-4-reductase
LVHFSSIQALTAISPDQPVDESSPLATSETVSVYDRSKALAEEAVLAGAARGLDAVIVTPTGVVGPYDFKTSLMGRAIKLLAEGGLRFLVAGGFDWVDVRDVAAGAIAAEECGRAGERYILSGHWCSIPGLAQLVDEITGRRRHRFVVPSGLARLGVGGMSRLARLAGRVPLYTPEAVEILRRYRHVSCRKAADELGYRARPLRSTLQDTVAWWREVTP